MRSGAIPTLLLITVLTRPAYSMSPASQPLEDTHLQTDFTSDTWTFMDVEFEEDYDARYPCLVFNEGKPCFSFTNFDQGLAAGPVVYAEFEGSSWATDTVFNGEHLSDLQIQADGTISLATAPVACLADSTCMTYIESTPDGWEHTNLYDYTDQHECWDIRLQFDSMGNPHIFGDLYNGSGAWVIYATRNGSDWSVKDDFMGHGMPSDPIPTALVVDNEDIPHLFYSYFHMYYQSGSWWEELVNVSLPQCAFLDQGGYIHLFHSNLKHMYDAGPGWVHETVAGLGQSASACIGSDGRIHAAFWDYYYDDLVYAVRDSTGWTNHHIDWRGQVGHNPSIALDAAGNPCIIYRDKDDDCLRMAWFGYETGIAPDQAPSVPDIAMLQTRPNPSVGSAHVVFDLTAGADLSLRVFDISGRLVRSESLGPLPAGQHNTDVCDLEPGTYLITLSSQEAIEVCRAVVL